jgi:hypothetical protein
LQSHYDIESSDDGLSYTFTTKFSIRYKIALIVYPLGDISAFSFSLDPDEGFEPAATLDFKIKNTVAKIIADILAKEENTVFYVCDSFDGKETQRHNVFEYWYEKCKHHHDYVAKVNHQFTSIHNYTIYSTLLYNQNNPLAESIIGWFKEAMNEM